MKCHTVTLFHANNKNKMNYKHQQTWNKSINRLYSFISRFHSFANKSNRNANFSKILLV